METCNTCIYFHEPEGQCRRYPPSTDRARWQNVRPNDWCGEFTAQPKASAKKAAGAGA